MQTAEVLIIGGGVMGCSIAFHLARRGIKSVVVERDAIGSHASSAAAGMLGAQVEMDEPGPLTEFCLQSRSMFPALQAELLERTGVDIELNRAGLLKVARFEEDVKRLRERQAWQTAYGQTARWLEPEECLALEPSLHPEVRGGLYLPEDWQVSAPKLTQALASAAKRLGANLVEGTEVRAIEHSPDGTWHVDTAQGHWIADWIVITAGVWSQSIAQKLGWHLPMTPVKGESLALRPKQPLFSRTLYGPECYLVPKANGEIIVGATERDGAWDEEVTAEAVQRLLQSAFNLVPRLRDSLHTRSWAGLRPGTPNRFPYVGQLGDENRAVIATGHYRNGILLSAATGDAVARLLLGEPVPELAAFAPMNQADVQKWEEG
ncbi:glycine oxidase ThiO [Laceyella sacchari]|jgi:glycine oxidase|uniref:glycine oxidase n=1 Tax=Laceyella tengchongensis TaxID=574699 RepID=A0AA46AEE2_9BACL|nr:glycine oxidase ThiO [Laceyella tengchongensis]AUS09429.1 glycine oxidase ThiO [Laceyella sacchari]SMP12225.1 glycine oxidase [Laceyella tengchongensis]